MKHEESWSQYNESKKKMYDKTKNYDKKYAKKEFVKRKKQMKKLENKKLAS